MTNDNLWNQRFQQHYMYMHCKKHGGMSFVLFFISSPLIQWRRIDFASQEERNENNLWFFYQGIDIGIENLWSFIYYIIINIRINKIKTIETKKEFSINFGGHLKYPWDKFLKHRCM